MPTISFRTFLYYCKQMKNFVWKNSFEVPLEKCTKSIAQYVNLKCENADYVLLFRVGEFFETYFEDAFLISKECEIALTQRNLSGLGKIPMAGVPQAHINKYIKILVDKDYKVALCEQGEGTKDGILERKIVRKFTGGTLIDDDFLRHDESNYIAAVYGECVSPQDGGRRERRDPLDRGAAERLTTSTQGHHLHRKARKLANGQGVTTQGQFGFAYCEISTGEFNLTVGNLSEIQAEIYKINPREILVPKKYVEIKPFSVVPKPETEIPQELIGDFHTTIISEGWFSSTLVKAKKPDYKLGYKCANAILTYVLDTQKDFTPKLNQISEYQISDYLILNASARKNLELTKNLPDNKKYGSLLWAIDNTQTSMGTRLLKNWINQPLKSIEKIEARQNAIHELFEDDTMACEIDEILKNCFDISRVSAKISNGTINPKDFLSLRDTLNTIPLLQKACGKANSPILNFISDEILELSDFAQILEKTISDEPANTLKEGGIIKDGGNAGVDALRFEIGKIENRFKDYEAELRVQTGIKNLKVDCVKVFGYFIEIPSSQIKFVPKNLRRKQTLSNAERFVSDILQENEEKITYLRARAAETEFEIYSKLRDYSTALIEPIREFAAKLAQLDVILSLYKCAKENNYTCPKVVCGSGFNVSGARHPSVEKIVGSFDANDISFEGVAFKILTGPNMAGKSTYMRSVAIIAILSQMGSFIPAKNANMPILDKIFIRAGSSDHLIHRNSTFKVEMLEVKQILDDATRESLILIDELGKGTSTLDGLAIARATGEYIAKNIGAKVVFATHFHGLHDLAQAQPTLFENLAAECVSRCDGGRRDERQTTNTTQATCGKAAQERRRIIRKGFSDKSYGLNVAREVGLPDELLKLAQSYLSES